MLSFAQDPRLTRWELYPKPTFLASEAKALFFRPTVWPPSDLDVCRATRKGGAGTSTSAPQQVLGEEDSMERAVRGRERQAASFLRELGGGTVSSCCPWCDQVICARWRLCSYPAKHEAHTGQVLVDFWERSIRRWGMRTGCPIAVSSSRNTV